MEVRNAATSLLWMDPKTQVKVIVATTVALFFITSFILCRTLSDHPIFAKKWSWISLTIALPNIIYLVYRIKFAQPVTEEGSDAVAQEITVNIPISQSDGVAQEVEIDIPIKSGETDNPEIMSWHMESDDSSIELLLHKNPWGIVLDYLEPYHKYQFGIRFIPSCIEKIAKCLECDKDKASCQNAFQRIITEMELQSDQSIEQRTRKFYRLDASSITPIMIEFLLWDSPIMNSNLYSLWKVIRGKFLEIQLKMVFPIFKTIVVDQLLGESFREHSGTLLMEAVCTGTIVEVQQLLDLGADPNEVTLETSYSLGLKGQKGQKARVKRWAPEVEKGLLEQIYTDDTGTQMYRGGGE